MPASLFLMPVIFKTIKDIAINIYSFNIDLIENNRKTIPQDYDEGSIIKVDGHITVPNFNICKLF